MIVVIIAGGSGTRLWPLSTPKYPKHLLKINGDADSLLQKTYQRALKVSSNVYVLTEASHAHHVKEHLPELKDDHCIVEPARRGTANCIVAALAEISKKHGDEEVVAFTCADHYIRDVVGFAHSFRLAEQATKKHNRITLVGIEPDYPSTGFGYIEKDEVIDNELFIHSVKGFKEKPDYDTAKKFLNSGNFLWNGGYFVASIGTFKKSIEEHAPKLLESFNRLKSAGDDYEDIYLSLESDAIEYALIEQVPNLLVVPASFDWMDLGSYGDLHKAAGSDAEGNHKTGNVELESVENSYIHNQDEKPIAVVGLDNVAVINTPSGILVTRKDLGQKVGEISKRIAKKGEEQ